MLRWTSTCWSKTPRRRRHDECKVQWRHKVGHTKLHLTQPPESPGKWWRLMVICDGSSPSAVDHSTESSLPCVKGRSVLQCARRMPADARHTSMSSVVCSDFGAAADGHSLLNLAILFAVDVWLEFLSQLSFMPTKCQQNRWDALVNTYREWEARKTKVSPEHAACLLQRSFEGKSWLENQLRLNTWTSGNATLYTWLQRWRREIGLLLVQ